MVSASILSLGSPGQEPELCWGSGELHSCSSASRIRGKRSLGSSWSSPSLASGCQHPFISQGLHSHWKGASAGGSRVKAILSFPVPRLLSRAFLCPCLGVRQAIGRCMSRQRAASTTALLALCREHCLWKSQGTSSLPPGPSRGCRNAGFALCFRPSTPAWVSPGKHCWLCWRPEPLKNAWGELIQRES